mgnify:CR=1 FL=1
MQTADHRHPATKTQAGFTLLEVVVALALVAVISSLCLSLLSTGTRSADRALAVALANSEVRLGHQFLRDQMSHAVRYVSSSDDVLHFEGRPTTVRFVQERAGVRDLLGWRVVILGYDRSQRTLTFESLPHAGDEQRSIATSSIVVDAVKDASFEYFGNIDDDRARWETEWNEVSALPQLIRLNVSLENGDEWPPLVVALRATSVRLDDDPLGALGQ